MKSNIRSKYIKDFLADQESLKSQLSEQTTDTIKDILGESVKESLRQLISEAEEEDSYEEEEVDSTDVPVATDSQTEDSAENADAEVADTEDTDAEADSEDLDIEDSDDEVSDIDASENEGEGDDVWAEMEEFKDDNGEYDLTGMDNDSVIRVLKVMNPETDGVRVIKNDDGKLDVTVPASDDEIEFIIDVDGSDNNEIESEEIISEANTGYTDNYQNKTAMTTLPNKEVADKKNTYSMDAGVPEGDSKPWVGKAGDMSPYSQEVNESENIFEIEIGDVEDDEMVDEGATTVAQQGPNHRGMTKNHNNTNDKPARGRLTSQGGEMSDGMASYNENLMRRIAVLESENKELKGIIEPLKQRVVEAVDVNYSLGRIIKLVTENTTSKQEKIDIISRFDKVKDRKEAKSLYESMERELKSNRTSSTKNSSVMQLAESKNANVTETSMYKSDDLSETVNLMKRMDSLGRK